MIKIGDDSILQISTKSQTISRAYLGGSLIFKKTCTVTFVDFAGNVISTQEIKRGCNAVAPPVPAYTANFYEYQTGWEDYSNIQSDTIIRPIKTVTKGYLYRSGYGINTDLVSNFGTTCTLKDADYSDANIASDAAKTSGAVSTVSKISVNKSFSGSTYGATTNNSARWRYVTYACSSGINAAALRSKGFTKLNLAGSYSFPAGQTYGDYNMLDACILVSKYTTISFSTSRGFYSDSYIGYAEKLYKSSDTSLTYFSAMSGSLNKTDIAIPTSGTYYIVAGVFSRGARKYNDTSGANGTITVSSIYVIP